MKVLTALLSDSVACAVIDAIAALKQTDEGPAKVPADLEMRKVDAFACEARKPDDVEIRLVQNANLGEKPYSLLSEASGNVHEVELNPHIGTSGPRFSGFVYEVLAAFRRGVATYCAKPDYAKRRAKKQERERRRKEDKKRERQHGRQHQYMC